MLAGILSIRRGFWHPQMLNPTDNEICGSGAQRALYATGTVPSSCPEGFLGSKEAMHGFLALGMPFKSIKWALPWGEIDVFLPFKGILSAEEAFLGLRKSSAPVKRIQVWSASHVRNLHLIKNVGPEPMDKQSGLCIITVS